MPTAPEQAPGFWLSHQPARTSEAVADPPEMAVGGLEALVRVQSVVVACGSHPMAAALGIRCEF